MGRFAIGPSMRVVVIGATVVVIALNAILLLQTVAN
jgi:hypothetical protein